MAAEEVATIFELKCATAEGRKLQRFRPQSQMLGTTATSLAPNCCVPSMAVKNHLFQFNNGVTVITPQSRRTHSVKASHGTRETLTSTKSKPVPREALSITKSMPVLVCPTKKTYDGLYYLSHFDQILMGPLDALFSFEMDGRRSTENFSETLKQALAEALVYFYPLAGSVTQGPDGQSMVKCTGEGVSFVEAVANCDLYEFGDLVTIPDIPKYRQLVNVCSEVKNPLDIPPLAVQVTRFQCGGFVLGISMNHCMGDGASLMAFMKSWGELARGLPISVPPFLDRSIMKTRQPLNDGYNHDNISSRSEVGPKVYPLRVDEESVFKSFCFDAQKLTHLKKLAMEDGTIKSATDFELIMAYIWCARTKALKMNLAEPSKLLIVADVRNRLGQSIPKQYFGNSVFFTKGCECSAGELIETPLSFAVGLMKRAIELDYIKSVEDYIEATRTVVLDRAFVGNKWSRLPSHDIDFGWGSPKQFTNGSPQKEVGIIHAQSKDGKNKILTLGLPASDMKAFEEILQLEMGMQACS